MHSKAEGDQRDKMVSKTYSCHSIFDKCNLVSLQSETFLCMQDGEFFYARRGYLY